MSKTLKLRLLILSATLSVGVGAYHLSMEDMMVQTAKAFTESLTPEQRTIAMTDFKSEEREKFHFVPDSNFEQTYGFKRPGLTYIRMQPEQRHLADALLSASLSRAGFIKAKTIMSLEEVLRVKEADLTGRRDPLRYYVRIYGEPSKDGAWAWRIEGHHMSLHFAMKGGKLVSSSPTFFGANPHKVDISPRKDLRALPAEEDLGFELIGMLNADQKKKAIIDSKAYPDILTGADTRAKLDKSGAGLPASAMTPPQVEKLMELIEEYAANLPAEVAAKRMEQAKSAPKDKLLFAWAGATERNIGDYYRIQAPAFLIEYDNTQNGANHTHTVWRDWNNDFGRDVLALHRLMYNHSVDAD